MRKSLCGWVLCVSASTIGCATSGSERGASAGANALGGAGGVIASDTGGSTAHSGGTSGTHTGGRNTGGASTGGTHTGGASSGGTNTGGASTGGSSTGGTGGTHVVGKCDALPAAGTWEAITPPGINLDSSFNTPAGTNYGVGSFVLDPQHSGTVYVGSSAQGIYKTTDCGSTWIHVNTGRNGKTLDSGRQWTMQIDPVDPQVLYTNTGYGASGVWKSTNGGVDWDQILPSNIASAFIYNGFVARVAMDPSDHLHLLVTPHFTCQNGHSNSCILETKDGGSSWNILENAPNTGEGGGIPMLDSKTWLWMTGNGIWRTVNGGGAWTQVYSGFADDGFYQGADGSLYVGSIPLLLRSTDVGANWKPIASTHNTASVTGDGTHLYASDSKCTGVSAQAFQPYLTAAESSPTAWSALPSPSMHVGGRYIAYDSDHHVLYSDNCIEGFFRAVVQ